MVGEGGGGIRQAAAAAVRVAYPLVEYRALAPDAWTWTMLSRERARCSVERTEQEHKTRALPVPWLRLVRATATGRRLRARLGKPHRLLRMLSLHALSSTSD